MGREEEEEEEKEGEGEGESEGASSVETSSSPNKTAIGNKAAFETVRETKKEN
jgi:hypothetical protein